MVSENDPTIEIRWFDSVLNDWVDITEYCIAFNTKNAGVLKVSQAEVLLNNKAGRFTKGESKIDPWSHFWILGKVRPVQDVLFSGRFYGYGGDFSRRKHEVTLVCRGYEQKLLRDTKTRKYEDDKTLAAVIQNFLLYPDSGFNTDITLETEGAPYTSPIWQQKAKEECNFEREYLLDCLKKIAERINYDGYLRVDVGGAFKLIFKEVGTIASDPYVTLTHPFVFVKPEFSIDDIENFFLIWGGYERGVPPYLDEWTEAAMLKYDPDIWIPDNAGTNIIDDGSVFKIGSKSIKISSSADRTSAHLDITKTEEAPYIDATSRFEQLLFWCKNYQLIGGVPVGDKMVSFKLEDSVSPPNRISWRDGTRTLDTWKNHKFPIGTGTKIYDTSWEGLLHNAWWYDHKETTFNWKITKAQLIDKATLNPNVTLWIDGLYFKGAKKIDPLLYPVWNPPIKDDNSVSWYGRSLAHYVNESIFSKRSAQEIGQTILGLRKNPHRKVVCKKGAKIWVKPSQVMTLNVPEYEIDNQEYRVLEAEAEWKTPKFLRTTFTLVPKTYKVSSKAYLEDLVSGLIRRD